MAASANCLRLAQLALALTFDIHARLDGHRLGLVVLVEGHAAQHVAMSLSHGGHLHHGGGRPGPRAIRFGGIYLRMNGRDFLVTCRGERVQIAEIN